MVVVVGGVGSLLGTFISAGFLGQLNVLFASYSNDIIARAAVFAAVILIILWRPKGLFSHKGR
jgi:urea transport system permease protein